MNLAVEALRLLKNRHRDMTFADIERATGLKQSWLAMFSRGTINDPSHGKVTKLCEFLSGKKVSLK